MQAALTIAATFEALVELGPFIEAAAYAAPSNLRGQITLAVHELCANIIEHAYASLPGTIMLDVLCNEHTLELSVHDNAPNAYLAAEIALPKPLDLPEGGWGMAILYTVFDRIEYERFDSGNHWLLVKSW